MAGGSVLRMRPDGSGQEVWARTGEPIRFADAVTIAPDGGIYVTDASRRFSPADHGGPFEASMRDFLERQPTGRVLVYRPGQGVEVVANGLSFANGILMSKDGRSVMVAESGNCRVWRIDAGVLETADASTSRACMPGSIGWLPKARARLP